MARDLLNRYIWLVDTIRRHGRITRRTLDECWARSPYSAGEKGIPRRTFYNYRQAVEELFSITINCDTTTYEYYIEEDNGGAGRITDWLLDASATSNVLQGSRDVASRIMLENTPSARENLAPIIEAIRFNHPLRFDYHPYTRVNPSRGVEVEPYFLRIFRQLWYVTGRNVADGKMKTYSLDRISGLRVLTKKAGAPIYVTRSTLWEWYKRNRCDEVKALFRKQEAGTGFQIGSLWVESFPTPHDAADSVGYSIAGEGKRVVLCTDLGHVTQEVRQAVKGCDLLVCETNHDVDWVRSGPYPYYLKQRILGDCGHLSNEAGAELAGFAAESGTRAVVLAHLSQTNNTPARAYEAAALRLLALGFDPERDISLTVAPADTAGATFLLERRTANILEGTAT